MKLIVALLLASSLGYAQHHLKGTKGIGLEGGVTNFGFYIGPSFDYNITPKLYVKTDLLGEFGSHELERSTVKIQNYYLDVSTYYNLLKIKDVVYFNGGLGVQGSFALLNDSNDGVGSFTQNIPGIGFYISPEIEFFITDRIVGMLNYRQAYYVKNEFGKYGAFFGGGIKYNL